MTIAGIDRAWQGSNWVARTTRFRIYCRDRFRCAWCGKRVTPGKGGDASLDHLDGRSNLPRDLTTTCLDCNSSRADVPPSVFASSPKRWCFIRARCAVPLVPLSEAVQRYPSEASQCKLLEFLEKASYRKRLARDRKRTAALESSS